MNVKFEYVDFDGMSRVSEAKIHEEGEWFWAENLAKFGCGKRVSSVLHWHPVRAALRELTGGREIRGWSLVK